MKKGIKRKNEDDEEALTSFRVGCSGSKITINILSAMRTSK